MSVNLVPEESLRAALRPYRVDPEAFASGVRERLSAAEREREEDPLAGLSPRLKAAAAFLPPQLLAGGKLSPSAAKMAPGAVGDKLFGYALFPAISLFVLLGATIFTVARIRGIRKENISDLSDEQATLEAIRQWWSRRAWGVGLLFAGSLALAWIGATWLLFMFYIVSFGLLLYVLGSFAKLGIGNRWLVGRSCMMGLVFLAQFASFPAVGDQDIHFVDQKVICSVFFGGALVVFLCFATSPLPVQVRLARLKLWTAGIAFATVTLGLTVWFTNQILWPATPSRIKAYVESFDKAPFEGSSWRPWGIVAGWAIESGLDPDLSSARRLLAAEIAGKQNRFVLSAAFRLNLATPDQVGKLRDYEQWRRSLLDDRYHGSVPQVISSLEQYDWAIRASLLRGDMTPAERDVLEKRLHATLAHEPTSPYAQLATMLRATQLLRAIGRPVDPDQYRVVVHGMLRSSHSMQGGGFALAGGFRQFPNSSVGDMDTTAYAVELMEVYGVPNDLDLNWVRSYLRPLSFRASNGEWIAAVSRDRLNRLPAATGPTWLEILFHERSLLAALVLVGLCIYATLSAPPANRPPVAE